VLRKRALAQPGLLRTLRYWPTLLASPRWTLCSRPMTRSPCWTSRLTRPPAQPWHYRETLCRSLPPWTRYRRRQRATGRHPGRKRRPRRDGAPAVGSFAV